MSFIVRLQVQVPNTKELVMLYKHGVNVKP